MPTTRSRALLCAMALLAVNAVIAGTLFGVEYSAYNGSIEGTFIAIARVMARHPGEWKWWPFWSGGMPFENSYLPLSHMLAAAYILITGASPARSFHIVTAAAYALGPVTLFWMAFAFSRRLAVSFFAALACSCVSLSTLLLPAVASDAGGALHLRRLQVLVFYGESPHTVALTFLPLAILCLHRALTSPQARWKILAGVLSAFVVLSNAFGIVALGVAILAWLLAYRFEPWWKAPLVVAAIGIASYCWSSPWLSPSMIRAIRANSSTTGGDYRYTAATWIVLAILVAGYLLLWQLLRRAKSAAHLQFFALFAYPPTAIVLAWSLAGIAILPQPGRYQLQMDTFLVPALVFAAASALDRIAKPARTAIVSIAAVALALQSIHSVIYARQLIRSVDPTTLSEYKISKWLDQHRRGDRAYLCGSTKFLYNVFTDNPQLHGGHDQFGVNPFIPIVDYTIYSGSNAGDRDAEYSIFWLKAFGAHQVSVSGPRSTEAYKPFAHPHKFDGVLPLLWRDGDDAIYEVPTRSKSLAHVIPAKAVVQRTPIHGLDIAPAEAYVAALDDARYPLAEFRWKSMSEAEIQTTIDPGQVVAVQITYDRGWEAAANHRPQPIRADALGLMVIDTDCHGPCDISLSYTGGAESTFTRILSIAAMLAAGAYKMFHAKRDKYRKAR